MYRHTQTGTYLVAAILTGLAGMLVALSLAPLEDADAATRWALLPGIVVLGAAAVVFRSLTITVGSGVLTWRFGPGVFGSSVPVAEIAEVETARTSLLSGWGVHWTRRGWLYNVAGLDAVRIRTKSGKSFLLGTDEPERLARAIRDAAAVARG